ncbi:hypothetical protein [Ideonella sp. A 288]|uniref:hypothetical protein n=1 Tax=Ideonella sp. A 288 TaxID=1962181 RepID=UPI000B4C161A|nr:hypothetical protein [Ideonella sp. A 288]
MRLAQQLSLLTFARIALAAIGAPDGRLHPVQVDRALEATPRCSQVAVGGMHEIHCLTELLDEGV